VAPTAIKEIGYRSYVVIIISGSMNSTFCSSDVEGWSSLWRLMHTQALNKFHLTITDAVVYEKKQRNSTNDMFLKQS